MSECVDNGDSDKQQKNIELLNIPATQNITAMFDGSSETSRIKQSFSLVSSISRQLSFTKNKKEFGDSHTITQNFGRYNSLRIPQDNSEEGVSYPRRSLSRSMSKNVSKWRKRIGRFFLRDERNSDLIVTKSRTPVTSPKLHHDLTDKNFSRYGFFDSWSSSENNRIPPHLEKNIASLSLQDVKHAVIEDISVSDYHVLYDNDLLFLKPPSYYAKKEFTQHFYTGSVNESISSHQESGNVMDDNKSCLNDQDSGSSNYYSAEEETLGSPVSSDYNNVVDDRNETKECIKEISPSDSSIRENSAIAIPQEASDTHLIFSFYNHPVLDTNLLAKYDNLSFGEDAALDTCIMQSNSANNGYKHHRTFLENLEYELCNQIKDECLEDDGCSFSSLESNEPQVEKKDEERKKDEDDKNYEDKGTEDNILEHTSNHICSGYCKLALKEEKQFILKDRFDRTSRRNVSKRKMDKILSHNDHTTMKSRKDLEF